MGFIEGLVPFYSVRAFDSGRSLGKLPSGKIGPVGIDCRPRLGQMGVTLESERRGEARSIKPPPPQRSMLVGG